MKCLVNPDEVSLSGTSSRRVELDSVPTIGEGTDTIAQNPVSATNSPTKPNITSPTRPTESTPIPVVNEHVHSVVKRFDVHVVDRHGDILEIIAELEIELGNTKENSKIEFSYNLSQDVPTTTATEMVKSLDLTFSSFELIVTAFEDLGKFFCFFI